MYVDGILVRHNEYPHTPGTLYDCLLCAINCYCRTLNRQQGGDAPRVVCVHCAENNPPRNSN